MLAEMANYQQTELAATKERISKKLNTWTRTSSGSDAEPKRT